MTSQSQSFYGSNIAASCSQKEQEELIDVYQRLLTFAEYFVKEFETKLNLYFMVLEGEVKKAGKYSEKYAKKTGKLVGGGITALVPGGISFLSLGVSLGEELISPILNSKGAEHHKGGIVPLAQLVFSSRKDKARVRRILVEASYDLFQSFEVQFMRVTANAGYQSAMQKLARDATNRAMDYLRKRKTEDEPWDQVRLTEAIIFGNSKIESTLTLPIPMIPKTAGFEVKYVYKDIKATWHTASLYEKVGLMIENNYYEKNGSRTKKYGYRRILKSENWEILKEEYNKSSDLTENMEFTEYRYVLSLDALEKQSQSILKQIDQDDTDLAEGRIKEMLGEVKEDLLEAINSLKIESLDSQDREILLYFRENLQQLKIEEYLKHFEDAKQERRELKEIVQGNSQMLQEIRSLVSSPPVNISLISNLPLVSARKFVNRPNVVDDIEKVLKQDQYLVICGISGTGKSTIAIEYGRNVWNDNSSSKIVRVVHADSIAKINLGYKLLAEVLEVAVSNQTEEEIMQIVHSRIQNSGYIVLFIFDNVEKYGDVEPYIGDISNINNIKVIITTKDTNVRDASGLRSIKLDPFTRDEAKSFIEANAPKNKLDKENIESLLDHLCSDMFVLPYSLNCAITHFKQKPSGTIKDYITDFKESHECTGTFVIFNELNKSGLSWHALQYSAFLDPDFISLDVLKRLLDLSVEEERQNLDEIITELQKWSFMKMKTLRNGEIGLKISHRLVQDLVRKYANANRNMENVLDKVNICKRIVSVLCTLFPNIARIPDEDWQKCQLLFLHATKLLYNIQCDEELSRKLKRSMLPFYRKLGDYNMHFACNLNQSRVYYNRALNVLIKILPQDDESNDFDFNDSGDSNSSHSDYSDHSVHSDHADHNDHADHSDHADHVDYVDHSGYSGHSDHFDHYSHSYDFDNSCDSSDFVHFDYSEDSKDSDSSDDDDDDDDLRNNQVSTIFSIIKRIEKDQAKLSDDEESILRDSVDVLNSLGDINDILGGSDEISFYKLAFQMQNALYRRLYSASLKENKYKTFHEYEVADREGYVVLNHIEVAHSFREFGEKLAAFGMNYRERAFKYLEFALDMQQAFYRDSDHPDIAFTLASIGSANRYLADMPKALEYHESALNMQIGCLKDEGQKSLEIADSYEELSFTCAQSGDGAEALKYGVNALEMREELLHVNHPDIIKYKHDLATICARFRYRADGLKYSEECIQGIYSQTVIPGNNTEEEEEASTHGQYHPMIAAAFQSCARVLAQCGDINKSLKYANVALQMQQTLYQQESHSDIAFTLCTLGFIFQVRGEWERSIKYYEDSISMLEALDITPTYIARTFLSFVHAKFGNITKALENCDCAFPLGKCRHIPDHETANTLRSLAYAFEKQGAGAESLKYYEKALILLHKLYPKKKFSKIARFYNSLGIAHAKFGDIFKALEYCNQALRMHQEIFSDSNHPDTADILKSLGFVFEKQGSSVEALNHYRKALNMIQSLYPEQNYPTTAKFYNCLGFAHAKFGDVDKALKYCNKALQMQLAMFSNPNNPNIVVDHPDIADTYKCLGFANEKKGDGDEALKYYQHALNMMQALYSQPNHPKIARLYNSLGIAHAKFGDFETALEHCNKALCMQVEIYPDPNVPDAAVHHPHIADTHWGLGFANETKGDGANALTHYEQALRIRIALYFGQNRPDIAVSLNDLGVAYKKFGDKYKSAEYSKQAYLMATKLANSYDIIKHMDFDTEKYSEFIQSCETREFIVPRGRFDVATFKIKSKVNATLKKVYKASLQGNWSSRFLENGVEYYLDDKYLCQQLGKISSTETIPIAKMLCFEAICLGILSGPNRTKNFTCAQEFAKNYPEVLKKITSDHPEYFVDGSVLRQCIFNPDILNEMVGKDKWQTE